MHVPADPNLSQQSRIFLLVRWQSEPIPNSSFVPYLAVRRLETVFTSQHRLLSVMQDDRRFSVPIYWMMPDICTPDIRLD